MCAWMRMCVCVCVDAYACVCVHGCIYVYVFVCVGIHNAKHHAGVQYTTLHIGTCLSHDCHMIIT